MKTSQSQFLLLLEFMEKNGDLSKPSGGPRGRTYIQNKWKELTDLLNSDGTGNSRSEEKWRKVWSDLKNNTKKKWARLKSAASGTGGGPALQVILSEIENRVMQIIGVQAATGMPSIPEAGIEQDHAENEWMRHTDGDGQNLIFVEDEQWNFAGSSTAPPVFPPSSPQPLQTEEWEPPAKKKKLTPEEDPVYKLFKKSEEDAREYERQRDRENRELEHKKLRLQEEWLEFCKYAFGVFVKVLEKSGKI